MRRTPLLGAATVAALAAGSLAVTGVLGSSHREAPKILADPTADNTDLYAFTAPDAPGSADGRRQLDPVRGAGGRPLLRQARPARPLLREDRQHGRRRTRTSPTGGSSSRRFRNPDSFLYAAPTVTSVDDPDINFVQTYDLYKETYRNGKLVRTQADRRTTCPSRPTTSARRRSRTTSRSPTGAVRPLAGGGKSFVGPVDDPFFLDLNTVFDGINIDKPGRPNIGLGNQGGGKDDISGYNTHVVRPAGAGVRGHARRPVRRGRRRAPTPSSASGPRPSASAEVRAPQGQAARLKASLGPGLAAWATR